LELDKKLTLLRRAPVLAALPVGVLRSLIAKSRERLLAPGEIVFEEGDPGQSMYVVAWGKVVVWKQGKRIAEGGPGDCFGEMALIESKERSARLFAMTDATVIEISEAQFLQFPCVQSARAGPR
jgi:CRP-like cAMP-binding protein